MSCVCCDFSDSVLSIERNDDDHFLESLHDRRRPRVVVVDVVTGDVVRVAVVCSPLAVVVTLFL